MVLSVSSRDAAGGARFRWPDGQSWTLGALSMAWASSPCPQSGHYKHTTVPACQDYGVTARHFQSQCFYVCHCRDWTLRLFNKICNQDTTHLCQDYEVCSLDEQLIERKKYPMEVVFILMTTSGFLIISLSSFGCPDVQ